MLLLVATVSAAPSPAFEALSLDFDRERRVVPPGRVDARYAEACAGGWQPACMPMAWHTGAAVDFGKAVTFFEPICAGGDALACLVTGWVLTRRPEKPDERWIDATRGAAAYRRACDAGLLAACGDLGALVAEGVGVPKDVDAGRRLARDACLAGDGWSCWSAAILDVEEADVGSGWASRGCDLGDARSCLLLGRLLLQGFGTPVDSERGLALLSTSCDAGFGVSCRLVGREKQVGGSPDLAAARRAYDLGCTFDDMPSCTALARMLLPTDRSQAEKLLIRACRGGEGDGCYQLGTLWAGNDEKAGAAFHEGCEVKHGPSCRELARIVLRVGDAEEVEAARYLLHWACDEAKDAPSCDLAAKLPVP